MEDASSNYGRITRLLLLTLAALLGGRWCYMRFIAQPTSGQRPPMLLHDYEHCSVADPILVGTHHKTGTVLLQHIFKDACPILGWSCTFNDNPIRCNGPEQARAAGLQLCFYQHGVRFKLGGGTRYRFVHAVRDPLEVVLSGYQYHLKTTERWARRPDKRYNGSSYREYLNSLPVEAGLRAEVKHSLRDALKTMPRLTNRTSTNPCTLTLRLEDFSAQWDKSVARLWDLMGVRDAALVAKLNRRIARHNVNANKRFNKHVERNASSSRAGLRRLLRDMPALYEQIQRVREKINYPTIGREASA